MVQLAARLKAVPLATICAVLWAIILGLSSGLSTSETAICGLGRLNFWATLSVSSLIPVPRLPMARQGLVTKTVIRVPTGFLWMSTPA